MSDSTGVLVVEGVFLADVVDEATGAVIGGRLGLDLSYSHPQDEGIMNVDLSTVSFNHELGYFEIAGQQIQLVISEYPDPFQGLRGIRINSATGLYEIDINGDGISESLSFGPGDTISYEDFETLAAYMHEIDPSGRYDQVRLDSPLIHLDLFAASESVVTLPPLYQGFDVSSVDVRFGNQQGTLTLPADDSSALGYGEILTNASKVELTGDGIDADIRVDKIDPDGSDRFGVIIKNDSGMEIKINNAAVDVCSGGYCLPVIVQEVLGSESFGLAGMVVDGEFVDLPTPTPTPTFTPPPPTPTPSPSR